jgi:MYXO-CTERM domain-containing protein
MIRQKGMLLSALSLLAIGVYTVPACAQTPVATYRFQDTLAADEVGVPALVNVNPLGLNGFEDAVVNGTPTRVFHWDGTGSPATDQAGLSLDATGLVQYDNYSVELIFEFLEPSAFGGGWRRIVDTQNRESDNGFYVSPDDVLQVYPVVDGTTVFTTPGFHHVVLSNFVTNNVREVKAYLDGVLELTSDTDQLNLDNANNPDHLLHFFLDNIAGPAQEEFADGRISFLRLYDGIFVPSVVPEPGSLALATALALFAIPLVRRRRNSNG